MKPDKPGFWKSRDGRRVDAYMSGASLYAVITGDGYGRRLNVLASHVPGDDWLPYAEPEFPKLPEKPKLHQCLVRWTPDRGRSPAWRTFRPDGSVLEVKVTEARDYVVIPHPDNDLEAVKLIEEARRGT